MSGFKYFDIEPILSRNALMTFIISSRGAGKTYAAKQRILRRFENNGEKFAFLKRRESELIATADRFFDDMETEHRVFRNYKGGHQIGYKSKDFDEDGNEVEEITWKQLGINTALSTTTKLKGISPQGVKTILWDEFVAYDGGYLPDEATRLLDVIETFGRMNNDVRVIATGNKNENGFYPIFHELGLPKTSDFEDDKIYSFKGGEVVIYSFSNVAYIKEKAKTKLGKVAKGTSYYESMIVNKNDSKFSELVHPKPARTTPLFSVVIGGEYYNIMFTKLSKKDSTIIYIENTDRPYKRIYTTDGSVATLPKLVGNGLNMLYSYITSGRVAFDSQVTAQKSIQSIVSRKR